MSKLLCFLILTFMACHIQFSYTCQAISQNQENSIQENKMQKINITGRLQRTVEAGGWIIRDSSTGKDYLILNAKICENLGWFKEGAMVTAKGNIKEDTVTIYMQGIPFQAEWIKPV